MIATRSGVYVDECDPLFDVLATYATWSRVKRATGLDLSWMRACDHLIISSDADSPDYLTIRGIIKQACENLKGAHDA